MSDTEALEWALKAAMAAAEQGTPSDRHVADRLVRAGTSSIEALRACERQMTWFRPDAGAPDPQIVTRHDVRTAAQAVLAELELIGIAWTAWDATTRAEMLVALEASAGQLVDHAERFNEPAI